MANSGAIAARPNTWKNMVRPGLSLYGYYLPFTSVVTGKPDSSYELPVQPALSWKTRIIALRDVAAHQPVGYSGAYVTQAPAKDRRPARGIRRRPQPPALLARPRHRARRLLSLGFQRSQDCS